MKKLLRGMLVASVAALMTLCLAACGSSSQAPSSAASQQTGSQSSEAASAADGKHIIGVAVYDVADSEVLMFKQYLMEYIAGVCFEDVQFVYSESIEDEDMLIKFIDDVAAMGGEGIMSFYNIDLQNEVERCAEHGMYHIVASGTVSNEDFASVADNEYFLGTIGPGVEMEYNAGSAMARNYIAHKSDDRYFIVSGGAAMGNEMHYQRVFGMLDALETGYGVDLGATKDLAASPEATTVSVDDLTVTVCPGYISIDDMRDDVVEAFEADSYDVVLSTIPVAPIQGVLDKTNVEIAMVDCYSQDNELLFGNGRLNYLAGKYGSLVGPSFVALYSAVCGKADVFRENGKAFKIVQNFWSSDTKADFDEKFQFASNVTMPAYNYDDLYSVCPVYNPDATFDDFKALATASSYEDAKKRRS